jgi:alpha-methylacyl-CoA racemase
VIRIDRPGAAHATETAEDLSVALERGRRSIALDLRSAEDREVALELVAGADALFEGFRPGVAERLGLGPEVCLAANPALVYGRMTGWGQSGPLAPTVGHDLNYIALAGALGAIGAPGGPPTIPLNLVGDLGGGGMLLAFGLLCGVLHARTTGRGQVVDVAMVDGVASLMAPFLPQREWRPRGDNAIDGGSHFYNVYETADGRWVTIASLEPQFYRELLDVLELDPATLPPQMDEASWPEMRRLFAERFRSRTSAEWEELIGDREICFAPVLALDEVEHHPHLAARGVLGEVGGVRQPMPAPRFLGTPSGHPRPRPRVGEHQEEILRELGLRRRG